MGQERLACVCGFFLVVDFFLRAVVCARAGAFCFGFARLVTLGLPALTEGTEARFLAVLLPFFFFDERKKPISQCQLIEANMFWYQNVVNKP
ncbi:MAG: hypothetical protein ACR2OJ_00110 [Hyphomicrobiales bacterium]